MVSVESGSRIDQYQIEELVAKSATSSIYRAIDVNNGRRAALKIPHPEVAGDPLFYSRLCRERDIGKRLDHPSVVKVIADDDASCAYLATEWVDGRLLRYVLHEQGRLPQDRAVKLTIAICDTLEYIHSQGVVHRDLKPENIMILGESRIKLIDFGIASQAGARRLTFGKLSQVMGSPDYISPEQVRGKRGDERSDTYAVGVMLYEMLTGKTPFQGNNPLAIMNSRLVNSPMPPREIDPTIPVALERITLRALERDPQRRYVSARQLSWDLRHQDQIKFFAHLEREQGKRRGRANPLLLYGTLALIPMIIFSLLLYVARHS